MSTAAVSPASSRIVGRSLVLSNDSDVIGGLIASLQQFAITADVCPTMAIAAALINTRKFEVIVVDLALAEEVAEILERIRLSPSNQNSVTLAVVEQNHHPSPRIQPNFWLRKPLTEDSVGSTLRASLGLIIRDYRRYFRCPIAVPLHVAIDKTAEIDCEMINISEGGLAIKTSVTFNPGALVNVEYSLPGEPTVFDMDAEICWCDHKGRAGLRFTSPSPEQQHLLQNWLSRKIEECIPEPVARLFQKHRQNGAPSVAPGDEG